MIFLNFMIENNDLIDTSLIKTQKIDMKFVLNRRQSNHCLSLKYEKSRRFLFLNSQQLLEFLIILRTDLWQITFQNKDGLLRTNVT